MSEWLDLGIVMAGVAAACAAAWWRFGPGRKHRGGCGSCPVPPGAHARPTPPAKGTLGE